jgi:hypothetical protein
MQAKGTPILNYVCAGAIAGALIAAGEAQGAEPAAMPDGWEVRQHDGGDSVELVTRNPAGAFGAICSEGSCVLFVEPQAGCDPGQLYPVMANSASTIALVDTWCQAVTESRDSDVPTRTLATVMPSRALMTSIANEERISLAFPQTKGAVDVVAVETRGLREALARLETMSPAATLPSPPPRRARPLQPAAVF